TDSGLIEAFDLMGFNPDTGQELLPITQDVALLWKQQSDAPQEIFPDENFVFFDAVTGKPTAWYRRENAGSFKFFNRPGFNPRTGEPLLVVDRDVLSQWSKYRSDNRGTPCYRRAFVILQKLVSQRYPAAFDNLGWIYYADQKNADAATASFRAGV